MAGECPSNDYSCYLKSEYYGNQAATAEGPLVDVILNLPDEVRSYFVSTEESETGYDPGYDPGYELVHARAEAVTVEHIILLLVGAVGLVGLFIVAVKFVKKFVRAPRRRRSPAIYFAQ